ncbi:MAG: hypothetical protein L3J74_06260, partial [Bacteroidales bacterium]|nr:hypothetical protein [Bacteroidales bacterium]
REFQRVSDLIENTLTLVLRAAVWLVVIVLNGPPGGAFQVFILSAFQRPQKTDQAQTSQKQRGGN